MDQPTLNKISKGGLKGWIDGGLHSSLPSDFFEDPISTAQAMGGETLKESRWRWAGIFTLPPHQRIFLKRDRIKGKSEFLKWMVLPSHARKEWVIAYQLKKKRLNVPKPLGWIERGQWGSVKECYYLSEAVGSGRSLMDDPLLRETFSIEALANILRDFHEAGLFHQDLHGGNLLWDGQSFFLTDLHRAKILRSLSLDQKLWNFSQLFHSLRSRWTRRDQMEFIERYFGPRALVLHNKEEIHQKILTTMDHLQRRQWRSRTKRCLKESTEFSVQKGKGMILYHRRDFPTNRCNKVIEGHLSLVRERASALVKNSPEVQVSLLRDGEDKICIKQFRYPHFLDRLKERFRYSKGLKSWIAGNGLKARGVPSLEALALLEKKKGLGIRESFFLMEASESGQELDRYLFKMFGEVGRKRRFIKTLAQWLFHFHHMDLYHQDMKACNILVSENGETWNFHFLDLEDVHLDEKVDEGKLFKNLLQLHTSIPKQITRTDRLRFLKEYLRIQPMIRDQKQFIRKLIHQSRKRGVVYVSPDGVVEETSSY